MRDRDTPAAPATSVAPAAGLVVVAILIAWMLWYPMRHASAYLDDYVFIALGQHIANPWALLVGDGIGSFFFRPLAMFLWAVSVETFGNGAPAQLGLSMALHVGNAALLYALVRTCRFSFGAAAIAALLFAVHPTTFAAAAWLSDRFDLLALFFGLASLIALERYLARPVASMFALACAAVLAALCSKEIAYGFVPAAFVMLAWPVGSHRATRRQRVGLALALIACAVLALAARAVVLRNVANTMFLSHGVIPTLLGGTWKWALFLPRFLAVLHGSPAALAVQWPLVLALPAVLALHAARTVLASAPVLRVMALGAIIMVACAGAQSPVVHASPINPFSSQPFGFDALAGSRFYYVTLAGFALVVAGISEALAMALTGARLARGVIALAVVAAAAGMLAVSRGISREWAAFIAGTDAPIMQAAIDAVKAQRNAPPGCKIYLLDTPKGAISVRSLIDTGVKQALPPGDPHVACFIQSEHAPWYHLVESRRLPPAAYEPLEIITFNGRKYPPLPISNLEYFYLKTVDSPATVRDPAATFYSYDGSVFRDVTEDVRAGRKVVRFYDNRPLF